MYKLDYSREYKSPPIYEPDTTTFTTLKAFIAHFAIMQKSLAKPVYIQALFEGDIPFDVSGLLPHLEAFQNERFLPFVIEIVNWTVELASVFLASSLETPGALRMMEKGYTTMNLRVEPHMIYTFNELINARYREKLAVLKACQRKLAIKAVRKRAAKARKAVKPRIASRKKVRHNPNKGPRMDNAWRKRNFGFLSGYTAEIKDKRPLETTQVKKQKKEEDLNPPDSRLEVRFWYHFRKPLVMCINVVCQGGKDLDENNRSTREDRDRLQRLAARNRVRDENKGLPKAYRLAEVRSARDKRNPAIELQSGRGLMETAVTHVALTGAFFAVNKVFKGVRGFIAKIKNTVNNTHEITQIIKNMINAVRKQASGLFWMVPVVMTLYYVLRSVGGVAPAISIAITAALAKVMPHKVWASIANFFHGGGVRLQSGTDDFSKLLCSIFTLSIFKGKMHTGKITELMKRIALFERTSAGWDCFLKWVLSCLETLINFVRERCGKERIQLIRKAEQPILDWAAKVDKMALYINTCKDVVDPAKIDELVELLRDGHGLKDFFRGSPLARQIDEAMSRLYTLIQPYQGALNARNNFRVEPECAIFTGAPGIGKTVMTLYICTAVMLKSGLLPPGATADQVKCNIWQKGNSKYWNSYSGQHSMVLDDVFQWKGDPTDPENQHMTIIRAISSWSYPLEFADVASKGKNFFNSKFVLGTCNTKSIDAMARDFVHEPEAVTRRIGHPYSLRVKPAFALENGRLDFKKFALESEKAAAIGEGIDAFPWHMWEAYKHDFITGRSSGDAVSVKDIIEQIAENLRLKLQNHTKGEADLDRFITGLSGAEMMDGATPAERLEVIHSIPTPPTYKVNKDNIWKSIFNEFKKAYAEYDRGELSWRNCLMVWASSFIFGMAITAILLTLKPMFRFIKSTLMSLCFWRKKKGDDASHDSDSEEEEEGPSLQSNRPVTSARKSKVQVKKTVQPQSGDMNVINNVYNNSYKIIIDIGPGCVIGQVIFVNDVLAVQPRHFTSVCMQEKLDSGLITEATKLKFVHVTQPQHSFEITVGRYMSYKRHVFKDADVECLKFEDQRAHKNVEASFITEKQLRYINGERSRLDLCQVAKQNKRTEAPFRTVLHFDKVQYGENMIIQNRLLVNRYYRYKANTDVGYCGAPISLVDNNSYSGHSVFGIHNAGDMLNNEAYCAVVTMDMLVLARKALATVDDKFEQDLVDRGITLQSGAFIPYSEAGSFLPIGTIDRAITLCPKTSYYPTKLFGVFGEYDNLPAPLSAVYRDGELVYPMNNAVKPYSSPVQIYDVSKLYQIAHVAFAPLTELTNKVDNKRIFTFEEAVCGIPELKFRAIPRQTAAGFPYCFDVTGGKVEFFGEAEKYDLTTPKCIELRERVDKIIAMAKNNERSAVVFNDFLKDELRSEKKVQAVATRLISSAPLDYVVAWRMYFGDFSSSFMRNHTASGMAPGICAYTDWGHLARMLSSKGKQVFAGDFKAFDSSEQPCVMSVILDYINAWYNDGDDNKRIRSILWLDLCHSRHIGGIGNNQRYLYQWNKSLPSGHPFTTIVNSMYSLLLLVACYINLTGDWVNFWTHCYAVTYGDDNVVNVDDDTASVYNQTSVAKEMWDTFRMTYTSDVKDSDLIETTDLDSVSFLKRKFLLKKYYWSCPLDLDSFLYCVYWSKNKRLEAKIRADELENALEELSLHPERVWDTHAKKVYEVLSEDKIPNAPCEQECYLRIVQSRADHWY